MSASANPKKKKGRPRLSDDDVRLYAVEISLNEKELALFQSRLSSVGLNQNKQARAKFIRKLILNEPINSVPLANKVAVVAINRVGVNLNQALKTGKLNDETLLLMKAELSKAAGEILGVKSDS